MNLGPLEVIVIFVVALLVFGPSKLPEIGRQVGRAVREFRRFQASFQNDFRDIFDEPPSGPTPPDPAPLPTADQAPGGSSATSPPAADPEPADAEAPETPPPLPSEPAVPLPPLPGEPDGDHPAAGKIND